MAKPIEIYFEYKFKPRFSDMDSYGIAHHSSFLLWFEESRYHFLEQELDLTRVAVNELRVPVNNLAIDYKRPVYFSGDYLIKGKLCFKQSVARLDFEYRVIDCKNSKLCAKGSTSHVFVNDEGILQLVLPDLIQNPLIEYSKKT
jgi:acyl-CoA thioester hydrolase